MIVVRVMLALVFAMELAATFVVSVDPMPVLTVARHPEILVSAVPIVRNTIVKAVVADFNVKVD